MGRIETWGDYRLDALIGRGGMAEVFRATRIRGDGLAGPVCLKRVRSEYGEDLDFGDMFRREVAIAAMLDHPNIVKVHDFDKSDGRLFLAMEYVEGMDLRQAIRRTERLGLVLPVSFVLRVMEGLLRALSHAHELTVDGAARPVIHRDVSPHNILLSVGGGVKLADFGIAKAMGLTSLTRTGVFKGKMAYLSPEQAEGKEAGPKSDLFCAGIVMWEALTGRRLFGGDTDAQTLANVLRTNVPRIDWLSASVAAFADRLLARDPADRFDSAAAALEALDSLEIERCSQAQAGALVRALLEAEAAASGSGFGEARVGGDERRGTGERPSVRSAVIASDEMGRTVNVGAKPGGSRGVSRFAVPAVLALALATVGFLVGRVGVPASPEEPLAARPEASSPAVAKSEAPAMAAADAIVNLSAPAVDPEGEGAGAAQEAQEETRTQTEAGEEAQDPKGAFGYLEVNCRPWATVAVDGAAVGTTPVKRLKLSAGVHKVTLRNEAKGFLDTFPVKIRPGKTARLNKEIP